MPADNGRSFIIDRLRSRKLTIDEFNFDKLQAPPLNMFLSPYDIADLREIATSVRLSGKAEERYKLVDQVLRRRGLVKFGAGTNRVVYRHPEFNDILFKIATDAVGMGDNPAEFRNQFLLKPFVAKTFEISPCGTVALVERVKPILNREEYLSVADDVFELINTWLIGRYVLADIGTRYFMNIGIRSGFGVVLIDYPYVYELDGNKLYCTKQDLTSPSGKCDGVIDYDDGFNFLVCTKCGARYHAKELAKAIESKIIKVQKEDFKMGIRISGGTNNVSKEVKGDTQSTVESLTGVRIVKAAPKKPNKGVEKTVNGVSVGHKNAEPEVKKVKVVKDEAKQEEKVEVKKEEPKKEVVSPVSFDEKVKETAEVKDATSTPVYDIEKATNEIIENINKIEIDDVKLDAMERMFVKLLDTNEDKLSIFKLMIKVVFGDLYDKIDTESMLEIAEDENLQKFINHNYHTFIVKEEGERNVTVKAALGYVEDNTSEPEEKIVILESDLMTIPKGNSNSSAENYTGMDFYKGTVTQVNKIITNTDDDASVILIIDEDGNYVTNDGGMIIAIDEMDDRTVDDISIVSSEWLNDIIKENETINPTPDEIPNEVPKKKKVEEPAAEEPAEEVKEAPVGVFPQPVEEVEDKMEEFLNEENAEE